MAYPCIVCSMEIENGDNAIDCDNCHRWNHLYCGTGITMEEYRMMTRNDGQLNWRCCDCDVGTTQDLGNISQHGNIRELDTLPYIREQAIPRTGITIISGGNAKGGVSNI